MEASQETGRNNLLLLTQNIFTQEIDDISYVKNFVIRAVFQWLLDSVTPH